MIKIFQYVNLGIVGLRLKRTQNFIILNKMGFVGKKTQEGGLSKLLYLYIE